MTMPLSLPRQQGAPRPGLSLVSAPPTHASPHGGRPSWVRLHLLRFRWLLATRVEPLVKRALDVMGALVLAPVLGPPALLAAVLVKLTDGGPMLYWQKRVGRDGRLFDFPKIRSMRLDAERQGRRLRKRNHHASGVTFKMRNDPRITWIGRIARRLSIDEIPQLWCVLAGDMSLVGPRPALPSEVRRYTSADRRRLDVTPGLTCLWQVKGRGDLPFDKQVQLDRDYISSRGVMTDLKILLATVPAVLTGKGAY